MKIKLIMHFKTHLISFLFVFPFLLISCNSSTSSDADSSNKKTTVVAENTHTDIQVHPASEANEEQVHESKLEESNQNLTNQLLINSAASCYRSSRLAELMQDGADTVFQYPQKVKKLSESDFNSLNALEHFIHSTQYPESFFQSCALFAQPENLENIIPAQLPFKGEGMRMSERQEQALSAERDSTIMIIEECMLQNKRITNELKRLIIDLQAIELIPALSQTFKESKVYDPYILTTICLLIKNKSLEFRESDVYMNLYAPSKKGEPFNYYKRNIPFTKKKASEIISLAHSYYQESEHSNSPYIKIAGGNYVLGSEDHPVNPRREVRQMGFEISKYEITNAQFKIFVEETQYITEAEKNKNALVFRLGQNEFEWVEDSTAFWRYPNGISEGGIEDKIDHPVTCISYYDAQSYCSWDNVKLPSIEQWEIASLGENPSPLFFPDSGDIHEYANIWHGLNHFSVSTDEDYITTSSVGSFKPNPFGLYDIYGNVFEFCNNVPETFDQDWKTAATRGGSWWCSKNSCNFFNSLDIGRVNKRASFSNNGFRVVR